MNSNLIRQKYQAMKLFLENIVSLTKRRGESRERERQKK
jgi:hypothetical protein